MQENRFKQIFTEHKLIICILLLSFLFSISYAFYYQIEPKVDARAYDVIAQNIVNGNGYREVIGGDVKDDPAVVRAGPVYEYVLAGIYKVFGHGYAMVWIIQALMHSLSALLIYGTCLLIFAGTNKKIIGLLAAGVIGFYPDLIEISAMLMTETLYIFLLCLSIYLFFLYVKNNKLTTLAALSLVFGLTTLTRPPAAFLLPVVVFYFLQKKQFVRTLIFIVLIASVLAPWAIRNHYAYGKLMPFGAGGAYNFWIGNHVGASGEQEPGPELTEYFNNYTVIESYDESMRQFKNFVLNSPEEFSKLTLLRVNKYFSILRPMGFWFYNSGLKQALFVVSSATFSFFVLIFGTAGILSFLKQKEKSQEIKYLLAFTIATPLIIFLTVVETRYRFQIYPFLAIFVASLVDLFKSDRPLFVKLVFISFIIIVVNGLIDLTLNFSHFKSMLMAYL